MFCSPLCRGSWLLVSNFCGGLFVYVHLAAVMAVCFPQTYCDGGKLFVPTHACWRICVCPLMCGVTYSFVSTYVWWVIGFCPPKFNIFVSVHLCVMGLFVCVSLCVVAWFVCVHLFVVAVDCFCISLCLYVVAFFLLCLFFVWCNCFFSNVHVVRWRLIFVLTFVWWVVCCAVSILAV